MAQTGVVKFFNGERGYGFIKPDDGGRDVFVHITAAEQAAEAALGEGRTFFEAVNCFLHDHSEERPRFGTRLRITSSVRSQPGWSEIEVRWKQKNGGL